MTSFTVGQPVPRGTTITEGPRVVLTAGKEAPDLMFLGGINRPSAREVLALTNEPLKIALLRHGDLAWFVITCGKELSFDASFSLGIEPDALNIRKSVAEARTWPEQQRCLVTLIMADTSTNKVIAIRAVSLSREFWITLADILDQARLSVSDVEYQMSMEQSYRAFPTTDAMLRAATIVETAGKV